MDDAVGPEMGIMVRGEWAGCKNAGADVISNTAPDGVCLDCAIGLGDPAQRLTTGHLKSSSQGKGRDSSA